MGPGTFSTPLHEPDAVLRCTQHDFVPMSLHSSQNLNSGHLAPRTPRSAESWRCGCCRGMRLRYVGE